MNRAPEDTALMLRYQEGDVAAFEQLYKRHNDSLYRYLLRCCRQRDTAEDLYQEVWAKIIHSRSRYRPTAKFTTFLYRVAHNCFIDHVRRNKRYSDFAANDIELATEVADGPDQQTERLNARAAMLRALESLPDEQRDAFLLSEEAGLGLDDIAHVTQEKRETIKSRLRYANKKLRAAIAAPGDQS